MGDHKRSHHYNHSTYADLVITGVAGLQPSLGDTLRLRPLLPRAMWSWFSLRGVRYHGHYLCILWDERGDKYHQGRGLMLFEDGRLYARRADLGPILCILDDF